MSEGSDDWFMRARGRVLGPFTLAQLLSLRDRGQLSQFHEVSRDRRAWAPAGRTAELFGGGLSPDGASAADVADQLVYDVVDESATTPTDRVTTASSGWFYSYGAGHQGPVELTALQHLASSGAIGPTTLVWRNGLPSWVPARQVPDLRFPAPAEVIPGLMGDSTHQQAPAAWNQPPGGQMPQTSGLAIASLVLGLLWLCGFGSLLATIFGAVALSQIARSNGRILGKGMAIAGLVLGIVGLSLYAFPFTLAFLGTLLNPR
ncbi:MAG: GYF domain-containing protein [Isosphaeraceae bacterium]